MKTLAIAALVAVLAIALVATPFSSAEAKKADTSNRLAPKSFGPVTSSKIWIAKTFEINKPADLEQRKLFEEKKAQEFMKTKYGM